MGIINRLGGMLGTTKELSVEEYMANEEMEGVDVLNEPADFYVKPITLQSESDIPFIQQELQKRNIILLNIAEMSKRPNTLKGIIDNLKSYSEKTNGDIAKLDEEKILLVPAKVKILKRKPGAAKK